ncbi:SDR family NAD(P)-dependent oxidoreductase [Pseudarthrobacter sp. Y6]|uniref:SDR family NAD(P)-dependent oxidoreductase n=1 Tax=Pseudarthrobacter sp. Y6 TaxID=3418422 RepID=UPI003CF871F6
MELDLGGKSVVISGAASGIGRACAWAFAEEGARLGLIDIDAEASQALQAELEAELGAVCAFVTADITAEFEVAAAVESIAARYNGIDVVVGSAGISGPHDCGIEQISAEAWDAVMAVNVRGQFLLAKHTLRYLRASAAPSLILIASDSSFVAAPGMVPYNASKGAVLQLTRALSVDLMEDGIRVNCVCPSVVDSAMSRADLGQTAETFAAQDYPVQRPEQVANHVLYLASARSSPVNGTSLVSDFGYLAQSSFPA